MAAGDLTTTLVARVRSLLDESTTGFFTTDEVYKALTDGQRELIAFVLSIYKAKLAVNPDEKLPEVLRVLQGTPATGTGTTNLPTGFLHALNVYTATAPVLIRPETQKGFGKHNVYLASTSGQPYCSFSATQIVFETSVTWTLEYLATPTSDIDATHDPAVGHIAYNALVEFATYFLLMKDENPRAQQHLQRFLQSVQSLVF